MGCCPSSLIDQNLQTSNHHNNSSQFDDHASIPLPASYLNKSKPFKKAGLKWTSDTPLTKSQLDQKQLTFWETAPSYGVT
jgi:hypothetical protein